MKHIFTSERLGFRNWNKSDLVPFTSMNQDENVMEFFPNKLNVQESEGLINRLSDHFDQHGYTFYAVDELASNSFIGFIGIINMHMDTDFTPGVEIGWRLMKSAWGKGYATEGARKCLEYGFSELGFSNIYSFTPLSNVRSEQVMKKIGMNKVKNFDHPKIKSDHDLNPHCLYLIKASNSK